MTDIQLRVAAKAVILNDKNEVLIVREGETYVDGTKVGQYGLPGGRLDLGEAFNDGLRREAKEETGLTVEPLYPLFVGEWRPVIRDVPHQIIAIFVVCRAVDGKVVLSEEHDHYKWIQPKTHPKYHMMEPDDEVLDALVKRQNDKV
jgi:8-oxo-dGTP diphosphatase